MTKNATMKALNFGVEVEFTGITREKAADIVKLVLAGTKRYVGGGYDAYEVTDGQGRDWQIMKDSSIAGERKHRNGTRQVNGTSDYKCELVTPILQYGDIETLQVIIRELRHNGAVTNQSCGIHIHVGAENFTPAHLTNLCRIFYSQEDLIYKAIQCDPQHRNMSYCKKTDKGLIETLKTHNKTKNDIHYAWYGDHGWHGNHYDDSRYRGLNLHAYFTKGTVEFRCFNSELHAGKVKAYIQLCLAMAQQALTQKRATAAKKTVENEKYAFRCWLLRLGLIGEEFKTCREHLLKHLDGNAAWKGGKEQAAAHKAAQQASVAA
jgi:hypothetical protein